MKIRMIVAARGSPDGVHARSYEAGSEHDLSGTAREEDLAAVFVREGWAERADAPKPEAKAIEAAPENKDAGSAPENRGRRKGK